MKCANCGAEIRVGCVYCPVCGKEAQIVSDYNILEDDYLDSLLQEGEKPSVPSKSKQKEKAAKPKQEKPTGKKSKKRMKHLNSQKYPSQHSNLKLLMMLITIYPNINENRYEIWLSLLRYDL